MIFGSNSTNTNNYNTEARSSSNNYEQNDVKFKVYTDHAVEHNHRIDYELSIDDTDNYYQLNPKQNDKVKSIYDKRRGSTSQEKRKLFESSKLLGNSINADVVVNKSMNQLSKIKNLPQIFTAATPVKNGYLIGPNKN